MPPAPLVDPNAMRDPSGDQVGNTSVGLNVNREGVPRALSKIQMFWIDGGSGQNMRLGAGQIEIPPRGVGHGHPERRQY